MTIWVQKYSPPEPVYLLYIVIEERPNSTSHNINNGVLYPFFFYNFHTSSQCFAVIINSLSRSETLRNLYLKKYDKEGVEAGFYEGLVSGKSDRDALKDNLAPMDFNNQFYVKDGKAVFYANPYDLGPYAAGYIEVSASVK